MAEVGGDTRDRDQGLGKEKTFHFGVGRGEQNRQFRENFENNRKEVEGVLTARPGSTVFKIT